MSEYTSKCQHWQHMLYAKYIRPVYTIDIHSVPSYSDLIVILESNQLKPSEQM